MNIFLDCGANDGCSVRKFLQEFEGAYDYKIYSFECNPVFYKYFDVLPVTLIRKAVYDKDAKLNFYAQKSIQAGGSSIYKEKSNLNRWRQYQVTSVDLDNWMRSNIKKDDFIILKLDIEGAEYRVLNQLIEKGTIHWVDELYCEFHAHKIKNDEIRKQHDDLIKKLDELKIDVKYWDALQYQINPAT